FFEHCSAVVDLLARDRVEARQQFLGARTAIGLDIGDDDILAALLSLPALAEHSEGLSGPRRRAQVYLETPVGRHDPRVLFPSPAPGGGLGSQLRRPEAIASTGHGLDHLGVPGIVLELNAQSLDEHTGVVALVVV